jgi:hypothetical protein
VLEIASYINRESDFIELTRASKTFHALLFKDSKRRAQLAVQRLGLIGAASHLWTRITDKGDPTTNSYATNLFRAVPCNLDFAYELLSRPAIQSSIAHNVLLDIVQAALCMLAGNSNHHFQMDSWLGLVPRDVTLLDSKTLLRPFQTVSRDDWEVVVHAITTGFRPGLAMLLGARNIDTVQINVGDVYDDEGPGMRELLDIVAPPSLVCWDLADSARRKNSIELAAILEFYACEIRDSGRARLFFVRARNLIGDGGEQADDDIAQAFDAVDPLAAASKQHIVEELRRQISLAISMNHRFDPQMFLALAESGHLHLPSDLPGRLETLIDPYMDPAVLVKLIDEMYERDGDIHLLRSLKPMVEKLSLEHKATFDSGNFWVWNCDRRAISKEEERSKRIYYNLGTLSALLRRLIRKLDPERGARLDPAGDVFVPRWCDPFGLQGLKV